LQTKKDDRESQNKSELSTLAMAKGLSMLMQKKGKSTSNELEREKLSLEQIAERNFRVNPIERKAKELNFEKLFEEALPPAAKELIYDIEELLKKDT
jgi:hypothetical protein